MSNVHLIAKWLCTYELTLSDSELASVQFYTIELWNVHAYNVPIMSDLDLFVNKNFRDFLSCILMSLIIFAYIFSDS